MISEKTHSKKTCLLIMRSLFCGGAEKQFRYIISEMESERRRLIVLLLNNPFKGEEKLSKDFISDHPHVQFYQLNGNVLNCNSNYKCIVIAAKVDSLIRQFFWLKRFLKRNQIDTVMFSYVTQLLMTPLFCAHGVKVIFNERNTGRQICEKTYKRNLLKRCHKVVANSQYAANYVREKTGINVEVFHNAIEELELEPIPHDDVNILVPARLMHLKNQELVIRALALMTEPGKKNRKLLLAGNFEDLNYVRKLKGTVDELKLNDRVKFCGQVDDMASIYRITDLVILPSLEEGTPNVLLEAFMYKIRFLASDIPMNADIVSDAAFLFNPLDSQDLADRINWILTLDDDAWLEKAEERRHFAVRNYGIHALHEKYEKLLFQ